MGDPEQGCVTHGHLSSLQLGTEGPEMKNSLRLHTWTALPEDSLLGRAAE